MTKRKNPSAPVVVVAAVSLVMLGAFIAACGLDDTVVDESASGPGSGSDATIGADGTSIIPDGATRLPDGEIIFVDAGPDGTPHILLDGADPDDADLSDATIADGGCASGEYACAFGGNTYCLGDCSACVGLNYACERTSTCIDSCSHCSSDEIECFRAGLLGDQKYCVASGSSCSLVGGTPVFCGQLPFDFVDCPGSDQVCVSNQCLTCGESMTVPETCSPSSNGKCNGSGPTCH